MPPVHFMSILPFLFFSWTRSIYYDMETASSSIPHISQHDQLVSLISNITCAKSSSLSFIKGFILGQLSVIVVVVLFVYRGRQAREQGNYKWTLHTYQPTLNCSATFHRDYQQHHPHEQPFRYRMTTLHRKRITI